jgi:predicted nuclease of predicted toxin-antitoxin system
VSKRVLLDEGVPRQLAAPLKASGFPATSYPNSWKQITNGELLRRAEVEGFDVLVTNDKNIVAQQNLQGRRISLVVLPTNLRQQVLNLAPELIRTIRRIRPGQHLILEPKAGRKR